jgi:hypothetical protein
MVPSEEVGMALNGTFLGASVLREDIWKKNFENRVDSLDKHRECWSRTRAISATVHDSNDSLSDWLDEIIDVWITKHDNPSHALK